MTAHEATLASPPSHRVPAAAGQRDRTAQEGIQPLQQTTPPLATPAGVPPAPGNGGLPVLTLPAQKYTPTTLVCPACGWSKTLDLAAVYQRARRMKVTCPCGARFKLLIEMRMAVRKTVQLAGQYHLGGYHASMMV